MILFLKQFYGKFIQNGLKNLILFYRKYQFKEDCNMQRFSRDCKLRRIAAFSLALLIVLGILSDLPAGILGGLVTAKAVGGTLPTTMTWTCGTTNLVATGSGTVSDGDTQQLSKEGQLVNTSNEEWILDIPSTSAVKRRKTQQTPDFQVNAPTTFSFPVVDNAILCIIKLSASSVLTENTDFVVSNVEQYEMLVSDAKDISIAVLLKENEKPEITIKNNKYLYEISAEYKDNVWIHGTNLSDNTSKWDYQYTNEGKKVSIQGTKAGEVASISPSSANKLYINANGGKYEQANTDANKRIQVNQNTQIYIPLKSEKSIVKISAKTNTLDGFNALFELGSVMMDYPLNFLGMESDNVSENGTSDSGYNIFTFEAYPEYDCELQAVAKANTYLKFISVEKVELPKNTISGTVTSSTALTEGMQVVLKNKSTGIEYKGTIGVDGSYSVEVPYESDKADFEVSVSDDEFIMTSDTGLVTLDGSNKANFNITLIKLSTVTVSGTVTGFDNDYDISEFALTFTAQVDSEFTPQVNFNSESKTYTAKLAKGVAYKVGITGAPDYQVSSPSDNVTYTESSSQDITVTKKTTYGVTLNLPDELKNSGKSFTYKYVNREDDRTYSFSDSAAVALRDGAYDFSIDGLNELPYDLVNGKSVTVKGASVTQTVTVKDVTVWNLYNPNDGSEYFNTTVQNKTGYFKGMYIDASDSANGAKLAGDGSRAQFNPGTYVTIPVTGPCKVVVTGYSAASCLYTIGVSDLDKITAATDSVTSTYSYTGDAPATVKIACTAIKGDTTGKDKAYLKSIEVIYEKIVPIKEQTVMPVASGNTDNLTVTPEGQKLTVKNAGGSMGSSTISSGVSYYGFPATTDNNILEADVVIKDCSNSTNYGIFFGGYNGGSIATVGIRSKTGLRGILSKSKAGDANASGTNTVITEGQKVHFTVQKTDEGLVITSTPKGGETNTDTYKYGDSGVYLMKASGKDTSMSYGFVVSGCTAVITNMVYKKADGTVLYDQNDCYYTDGVAPVVSNVTATAATTRDYIEVNWEASTEAEGDGMYVLQVSKSSSENGTYSSWTDVETDIEGKTYKYPVDSSADGYYKFRVAGKLGVNGTVNTYKETSGATYVKGALDSPEISISSTKSSITLSWPSVKGAERYEIYRYSYDEGEDGAKIVSKQTSTTYTDTSVEAEMPYYYYVVAYSDTDNNWSNPSETVWSLPSAGHTGTYVYETKAAGITITKRSYDTVFNGKITLEGVIERAGTAELYVNEVKVASTPVKARGTFSFKDIAITQGRNDVNLIVTDTDGNKTRQTFNYVYLTDYDIVVDCNYEGTPGNVIDGIVTYKTVQEAVNSIPSNNTQKVTIFVKEGDYHEHLVVNSPNITLIGEDSEKTRVYFDSSEIGQVGGDMGERCAVKIASGATNFSAENITFENTYAYVGTLGNESCDALRNDAENTVYVNVRLLGYQDTLCANGGKQYYYKCYIAGNVDFIYGNEPRALFSDCTLMFRYSATKNSGYVCAPRTAANADYGLTFVNCRVLSEDGCSGNKYFLARPWGQDAYITWINCYMGRIIKPNNSNPYSDMSGTLAVKARFYEYGSYGYGYEINKFRRQISVNKANSMQSVSYLGWDPYTTVSSIGSSYVGTLSTTVSEKFVTKEYVTDSYSGEEGDDSNLAKYNLEGYAALDDVTGGGLLYETSKNYYKAGSATEFLQALLDVKESGMPSVIEITADINLGDKEVENFDNYNSIIKAHGNYPLTHPTLIKSGMSQLKLDSYSNLTIFSNNASSIKHACINISGCSNIIIRNIKFDEMWEWDDDTEGAYDRNDWDIMTIEKGSSDIWIDHCTFYKAYDGVIDIKSPTSKSNITISWCEFLPGSEDDIFFNEMMTAMESNPGAYPYYSKCLEEGMTAQQIRNYAYGQKKTHLLGQADDATDAVNITLTLSNNVYTNSMDRMPRLRYGTVHEYNCILDAQTLCDYRNEITNEDLRKKIVSNGASSTCGGHMLLQNCLIKGIINALNSGNGDSPAGYINAIDTEYYMDGIKTELTVGNNNSIKDGALIQDAEEFLSALPQGYSYTVYDSSSLEKLVTPYAGAGKLTLTTLQWEKTFYNDSNPVTTGLSIKSEVGVGAPETEIDTPFEEAAEKIFTKEELQQIANGVEAKIILKVDNAETVSDEDKALIDTAISQVTTTDNQYKLGQIIDISLFKKLGVSNASAVSETNGPLKIKVELPENLITKENVNRVYKVVRIHEGKTDILDAEFDKTTGILVFETDKFSLYAIVYYDEAATEITEASPDTGDTHNVTVMMGMLLMSVLAAAGAYLFFKKEEV